MTATPILRETDGHARIPAREPTVQQLSLRHARALGRATAVIDGALAELEYASDPAATIGRLRKLLWGGKHDIEAFINGKGESVTERHGLRVVGSLASVTGGEHG